MISIKTLITADDFGFSPNINRAIIEAYEKGRVTELSLMVDSYGSDEAFEYIRNDGIENVGLHFSLTRLSKDKGILRGKDYDDILKTWTKKQLAKAFDEEVEIFENKVGYMPKHIIGHKQISLNSKIIRHIADYCVKNNCYARRGERTHTLSSFTLKADETPKGLNIGRTADAILGFRYGSPPDMYAAYKQDLAALKQSGQTKSIEIFSHPGYPSDFERNLTSFIQERLDDINFLLSDYFTMLIEDEELRLISSSEI